MGTCISSGDTHTKRNRDGSQLVDTQSDVGAASTSQPDVRNPLVRDTMLGSSQISQENSHTNGSSLESAPLPRPRSPAFSAITPLDTAVEDHGHRDPDDDSFPSNSTGQSPRTNRGANRDASTGTFEFSTGFSEGDFSFASEDRAAQQRNMSLGSGFQSLDGYVNESTGSSRDLLKSRVGAPPSAVPSASPQASGRQHQQQQQQQQQTPSGSPRLDTLRASDVAAISKSLDVKIPQALHE